MTTEYRTIRAVYMSIFLVTSPLAGQVTAAEISIDPRATYLRTNNDAGALAATPIGLSTLSILPGDTLRLERLGDFDCGVPCVDDRTAMIGVFSGSSMLLSADQLHRVPDAGNAGNDIVTSVTHFGGLPTDIPEDFLISDTIVVSPSGATHLFVVAHDSLYNDNSDPDGDFAVRIAVLAGLPGDYNQNGVVDAADYVVWRKNVNTNNVLPNDLIGGTVGQPQFDQWRAHFGEVALPVVSAASRATDAIPEPAGWLILMVGVMAIFYRRQKRIAKALFVLLAVGPVVLSSSVGQAALIGHGYAGWNVVGGVVDFSSATYVADREDPNLDYWNGSPWHIWRPVTGVSSNYGVEWNGYVRVEQPGQYGLGTISDDGSQVWIDGTLVVDNHELQWYDWEDNISEGDMPGASFPPLVLSAGFHAIRVRWYEEYNYSGLELWWLLPDAGPSDIPYYGQTFHGVNPTYNPNTNWDVVPAASLFATVPALPGDYSQNGVVDAADYVAWRENVNTSNVLPNDPIGGTIGQPQFNQWRANFGQTAGSGSGTNENAAVPEPTIMMLLMLAAAGCCLRRHRTA